MARLASLSKPNSIQALVAGIEQRRRYRGASSIGRALDVAPGQVASIGSAFNQRRFQSEVASIRIWLDQ
jgi:hypothetical protein